MLGGVAEESLPVMAAAFLTGYNRPAIWELAQSRVGDSHRFRLVMVGHPHRVRAAWRASSTRRPAGPMLGGRAGHHTLPVDLCKSTS
jgi:hypothetical protein